MCWDIRKQIFENYLLVEDTKRTRSYPILFIFPFIHFFNTYIWQLFFFFPCSRYCHRDSCPPVEEIQVIVAAYESQIFSQKELGGYVGSDTQTETRFRLRRRGS